DVTDTVTIDGGSQPGAGGAPVVELRGDLAGPDANGLALRAPGSTVRGLVIDRFRGAGVALEAGGGATVEGNYIGTEASGAVTPPTATAPGSGNGTGVLVVNSPGNVIGGTGRGSRNVISGNQEDGIEILSAGSSGNRVVGNFIGPDARLAVPAANA